MGGPSQISVQGNGEECAQTVQILCMYRKARIYSKDSLQATLYVSSIGLKNGWTDLQ
jgi:hypothetical protein